MLEQNESFRRLENTEEDYLSCGWLFSNQVFDFKKLHTLFYELNIDRIKATVLTQQGAILFNCINQTITTHKLAKLDHSRIELISTHALNWDETEQRLLKCLV